MADSRASGELNGANAVAVAIHGFEPLIVRADEMLAAYRQAANREPQTWIKTPSYIVSTSRRPEEITGGHNLDSRIVRFEAKPDIPPGTVAIRLNEKGERVITINPADTRKVAGVVRTAAREDAVHLKASLERALHESHPVVVTRNEALGLAPNLGPAAVQADRGLSTSQIPSMTSRGGWSLSGDGVNTEYRGAGGVTTARNVIFIDRSSDSSYRVTIPDAEGTYLARSYDAAVDLVAQALTTRNGSGPAMTLYFTDLDAREAGNFLRSAQVRSA